MILIDTHVLVWALQDDPGLGGKARNLLDEHIARDGLMVSAISVWELALLATRGRLALGTEIRIWIGNALALPGIMLAPLEPGIAIDSVTLPGQIHKDPADRIIIATARHHGLPLLTSDQAILDYGADGYVSVIDARY